MTFPVPLSPSDLLDHFVNAVKIHLEVGEEQMKRKSGLGSAFERMDHFDDFIIMASSEGIVSVR